MLDSVSSLDIAPPNMICGPKNMRFRNFPSFPKHMWALIVSWNEDTTQGEKKGTFSQKQHPPPSHDIGPSRLQRLSGYGWSQSLGSQSERLFGVKTTGRQESEPTVLCVRELSSVARPATHLGRFHHQSRGTLNYISQSITRECYKAAWLFKISVLIQKKSTQIHARPLKMTIWEVWPRGPLAEAIFQMSNWYFETTIYAAWQTELGPMEHP